ncbi:Hypothetical_protein [Hexamita inflata]|uniref:Hypothetical_protein n=1 Tax=Hexamita inflata TaxID=28002 RepID=A0AA86QZU0_9EUKA|nr:Hypothetical protein HINF_LOCUS47853 [Hexamita inflata]CAI9960210.1 Hypothetical protein HINF_LOCUS47855 [Hexamita inflata]CAI9960215.1 Hypothetical protein HINF_LOCUS47860 [Hexamita inflata]
MNIIDLVRGGNVDQSVQLYSIQLKYCQIAEQNISQSLELLNKLFNLQIITNVTGLDCSASAQLLKQALINVVALIMKVVVDVYEPAKGVDQLTRIFFGP